MANDLERRREIGQFFTPPLVAGFVWDMLEAIHGGRFPAKTRVIDPACGEGVFLREAAPRGKFAADRLFGIDIDETLAAVWGRDPLLKAARLAVANGLLDLPDRGVQVGSFDVVVGNPPFAGKGVRDLLRLLDETDGLGVVPETDLFGALVLQERPAPLGPPLKPQDRAKLDQLAKQLGRYTCWRLGKDTDNGEVESTSATTTGDLFTGLGEKRKNGSDEFARAAGMVSAWPLNRLLDPRRTETRLLLRRLASTAIEVFFMERFLRLAKPGGLIAVIVPESILASDQLGPLRTWLLTEMDLLAVVSLPQKVFAGVGANARTSVVFARRLLRPRKADDRPAVALEPDAPEDAEDNGTGPSLLMAAPNTTAPRFNLEHYFATVLQGVREHAKRFPAEEV
ncbi:MAG: N-6 DNA methylase [Verrucomicrobia bacterium]|nr:N-6 DNA methylase [Verrucomicrobiota bacterium]